MDIHESSQAGVRPTVNCYVFLGPPGVGKGTMAEMLCRDRDFAHLSTGDLLRQEIRRGSSLGEEARQYIDRGELVPDRVVAAMVSSKIGELVDTTRGILFDGYPRTTAQAELLREALAGHQLRLTAAILFEAPEELLVERLSARRVCESCGAVFNCLFKPPRVGGTCDQCDGSLSQRSDDQPDTVRERLRVYQSQTAQLIDYYDSKGLLLRLSGAGTVDENYTALIEALRLNSRRRAGNGSQSEK